MRLRQTKKQEIETPPLITKHPREFIEELLNLVIYQFYGIEYDANVTHPPKLLTVKTENKKDYVFTCFELANTIDQPPQKISSDIKDQFIKLLEKTSSKVLGEIKVEAINGYINFELSEQYLSESVYYVAHWLQMPDERKKRDEQVHIIVEGPSLGEEQENKAVNRTFYFLLELYTSTGYLVDSKYLISDASEDAARISTPELMTSYTFRLMPRGHNEEVAMAQFERRVRHLLAENNAKEDEEDTVKRINKLRKSYMQRYKKELQGDYLDPKDMETESAMTTSVQKWLDEEGKKHDHIVMDPTSKAAYYHIPLGPLASLRTAHGSLFRAAYLLYSLDTLLNKQKGKKDRIIVVAPKKYHQLLYCHADVLSSDISYKTLICIDAQLVHATLPSRRREVGPLAVTSQKIAHTLASAINNSIHTSEARSQLLGLIDYPVDLNQMARQMRLLEIFSLIHNNIKAVTEFSAKPVRPKLRVYHD